MSNTYNGWTNYETWRVNLEWFDGMDCTDWGETVYDVAKALQEHVEDCLSAQMDLVSDSRIIDYAMAFIQPVNWKEIAEHMLDEYNVELKAY